MSNGYFFVEPEAQPAGVVGGVALAGVEVEADEAVAAAVSEVHGPRAGGAMVVDRRGA